MKPSWVKKNVINSVGKDTLRYGHTFHMKLDPHIPLSFPKKDFSEGKQFYLTLEHQAVQGLDLSEPPQKEL